MVAAVVVECEMFQRPNARVIFRIVGVLVAAGVLAGCDRCGDFFPPIKFESQVCKPETPRPQ
jgi:hypothetical protein